MACRPLKSIDFNQFKTPSEVIKALDEQLGELVAISSDTDFFDANQRALYERNIVFIKGYFERYEKLLRLEMNGVSTCP